MTMQRIASIDPATATGSNKKYFEALQSGLGLIPNMTRAMPRISSPQSSSTLKGLQPNAKRIRIGTEKL